MTAVTSTRDALLGAAWDAAVGGDWERTRMADVAASAGVSRQTLYNEFGSKDHLAQALVLRETERFLTGITVAVDGVDPQTPADAVRAAVEFTLTTAADNPLVKAVLIEDAGLLPFLTTRAEPLLVASRTRMALTLSEHWPALPAAEMALAAETVTRLVVSYLVLPSDSDDATARAVADRIAHLIERLFAESPCTTAAPTLTTKGTS